jgi:hypothetical protein
VEVVRVVSEKGSVSSWYLLKAKHYVLHIGPVKLNSQVTIGASNLTFLSVLLGKIHNSLYPSIS